MNNIQRADVTLLLGLWMTKLHFARHSLLLLLPHIPKQLDRSRPMPGIQFHAVLNSKDYTVLNYEATAAGTQMAAEKK
jgi:hypothetical protein